MPGGAQRPQQMGADKAAGANQQDAHQAGFAPINAMMAINSRRISPA